MSLKRFYHKTINLWITLLITTNIMGCMNAPLKKSPEIWFIDPVTDVLYRRKNESTEYAIPIKNNPSMLQFMCIPSGSFDETIMYEYGR